MLRIGELTSDEIDEMIKHYDTDNDGKINFDEYLNLMTTKWNHQITQNIGSFLNWPC